MNTDTATLELASSSTSTALVSKAGKHLGTRYFFNGTTSASDLRKSFRASGLKGSELDKRVNDVLTGNSTLAEQLAHAYVTSESRRGIVWDVAESYKGRATLKGVLPKAAKPAPAAKPDIASLSREEQEALFAQLAATLAGE